MSKLHINNRRYIGSKASMLLNIDTVIKKHYSKYDSPFKFADLFAGTGIVAEYYFSKGKNLIVNDILLSNYYPYKTWISNGTYNKNKINQIIERYNNIDYLKLDNNYFSDVYGKKYFSIEIARKIGYIRDNLESNKNNLTDREFAIVLTSLIYATDKIANTVGHFEHYLSKRPNIENFTMRIPQINNVIGKSQIFSTDANKLVKTIKTDIAYIDPPYNARQYINFYHVLENLTRWEKPTEFEGNSMKFKRNNLKSDYSKAKASVVFDDLISNLSAKLIIVSYNNTYSAKSSASNNKISINQLESILSKKGNLVVEEFDHKHFNSGKTCFNNHKEKLYICEVKNV
jgi:adenine-specific DNA-methyltransferase